MNNILYILPKSQYFSQGWRGRVTHAIGVINGVCDNETGISVISGSGLIDYADNISEKAKLCEVSRHTKVQGIVSEGFWQNKLLKSICRLLISNDYNIVIIRYAVGNVLLNFLLLKLFARRVKTILEINSLAYHQLGHLPDSLRKIIIRLEIQILNKYNSLYVVSDQIKKDLLIYSSRSQIHVIPNGSDKPNQLVLAPATDEITRFVYFGKFQQYYDFIELIKDFITLSIKVANVELHFWGAVNNLDLSSINPIGLKRIHFHGAYRKDDLQHNMLRTTDILILPFKPGAMASIGSPTKLYEYMSFGLPIISAKIGQVGEVLTDKITGYYYIPDQRFSRQKTMLEVLNCKSERVKIGEKCKIEFLSKHTWKIRMNNLLLKINPDVE
ncbi:glycosyltransferase [candidate division KSB1 bacterium]|nr:glycosyltransferase [candidate division KSB1 bacterium]